MNLRGGTRTCKSCGAEIVWVETIRGRPMPCNPEVITVMSAEGLQSKMVKGRIPHWATCPDADKWRKKKP